ncbi:Uu.00g146300.m01.CDS01 [Anthostomella pinea]|uniref:DNA (cytosine-5-)-methyltransferase n=1 Tax=Anthostomella pinea TaxID=933095 RepID=A0AAI8YLZ3_9PEZI|nr:Uu.00g146300.m01.CDS01 [Anthostomella pinea]
MEEDHDFLHLRPLSTSEPLKAKLPTTYSPERENVVSVVPNLLSLVSPEHFTRESSHGAGGFSDVLWQQRSRSHIFGPDGEPGGRPDVVWDKLEPDHVAAYSSFEGEGEGDITATGQGNASGLEVAGTPKLENITVQLPQSTLTQPIALFEGFVPPAEVAAETDALSALLAIAKPPKPTDPGQQGDDHVEFDLESFSIYIDHQLYPDELRPLHHLATRQSADRFFFDGLLSHGDTKLYLRKIPFRQLPIGNYETVEHTVGDQIWIRSELNEVTNKEIYYKLGSPSKEYVRFHTPFLWIANLAKHVINYCEFLQDEGRRAMLQDFKSRFGIWILQKHLKCASFEKWYAANGGPDFRGAIIANVEFIWKEAYGLEPKITSWHGVWKEIKTLEQYKPNLALPEDSSDDEDGNAPKSRKKGQVPRTVVTPYVHNLFAHMIFGSVLRLEELSSGTERRQFDFLRNTQPTQMTSLVTRPTAVKRTYPNCDMFIASIQPGDVISTKPDDDSTDTQWKAEVSKHYHGEHLWFGLVQKVHQSSRGKYSFDVIWMYQPMDTPCAVMKYPWNNELFLSDNCTCHHGTARIQADQILSTHEVEWFGNPSTSAEFFVRQTYIATDCRWTTLQREHMVCGGDRLVDEAVGTYQVGDSVLVDANEKNLETFIVEALFEEGNKQYAGLRRLWRRNARDKAAGNSPPNELVYSEELVDISTARIARRCLVRAFQVDEKIPSPYNRNGTGNAFYITHEEVKADNGSFAYVPLRSTRLEPLRQGFHPSRTARSEKLQGLDLFCGGGNFGRGLEDGGGIEMKWANDIWKEAIHTYMANTRADGCTPYLGSIDDLLSRALQNDSRIPRPGDVHFISGGSPCPGFSMLTIDKTTDKQRKNQSLVASFASFVDLYRPHYGVLENVPQMVNTKKFRDTCVFSQLVCSIVGLGYQVQIVRLDAWSFGAPQSRSRVFLLFSAPGFRMPNIPTPSHSHPPGTQLHKLGVMSCGRPFDSRELVLTSFEFVSAAEAVGDLPNIYDAKADYCVGVPDHRLSIGYTPRLRKQLSLIPTQPFEMNFSKAWFVPPGKKEFPEEEKSIITESERELYPKEADRTKIFSKGWGRINPKGIFGTISTTCQPTDSRVGCTNHWEQPRPITIMEARRAQGFLDHEVLVGSTANQFRIVGNSVARQVALGLGLAIREAWFGTLVDEQLPVSQAMPTVIEEGIELPECTLPCPSSHPISQSIEEKTQGIDVEDVNVIDSSSDEPAEDVFMRSDSQPSATVTPATSESNPVSDSETNRKRPSQIFVEIFAKRPRLSEQVQRTNYPTSKPQKYTI